MTALYTVWHLLIDGLCAWAMFGKFVPNADRYSVFLTYNFCAFALQMPLGVILDGLNTRDKKQRYDLDFITAVTGVICTVVGIYTSPVVLGIGNALFHIGGCVGIIHDNYRRHGSADDRCNNGEEREIDKKVLIRRLGIFIATGIIGQYIGTELAYGSMNDIVTLLVSVGMILMCVKASWTVLRRSRKPINIISHDAAKPKYRIAVICIFVVIARFYISTLEMFLVQGGEIIGLFFIIAIAGGIVVGGFAASVGRPYCIALGTLAAAAGSYLFVGICFSIMSWLWIAFAFLPAALVMLGNAFLLYGMVEPIILYWMICAFPRKPGFALGILNFAMFLGFIPLFLQITRVPLFMRIILIPPFMIVIPSFSEVIITSLFSETMVYLNICGCVVSALLFLLILAGLWGRRKQL